jgi:predicted transcriptional regulator
MNEPSNLSTESGDHNDQPDADRERVLRVTIQDSMDALGDERETITNALRGESPDGPRRRLNFHTPEQFQEVFNATTLTLIRAIQRERPESIRDLARLLERNVSPVHSALTKLESYGLVAFEEGDNRAKRPVVPYDRIRIDVTAADETDRAVASGGERP